METASGVPEGFGSDACPVRRIGERKILIRFQYLEADQPRRGKEAGRSGRLPIVTFSPATKADLKPGATVFVPARRGADGALSAETVIVGTNGVNPPM